MIGQLRHRALPDERRAAIESFIREQRWVTVAELCAFTQTSSGTVRRDLAQLSEKRVIVRVHGGAIAPAKADEWH